MTFLCSNPMMLCSCSYSSRSMQFIQFADKYLGIMSHLLVKFTLACVTLFSLVSIVFHTLKIDFKSKYEHMYRDIWARKLIKEYHFEKVNHMHSSKFIIK